MFLSLFAAIISIVLYQFDWLLLFTRERERKRKREREKERDIDRDRDRETESVRERDVLFVGCLTSQQHASVSQGRICSDNFTCCHTEIEARERELVICCKGAGKGG